jgi:hypothetical protein
MYPFHHVTWKNFLGNSTDNKKVLCIQKKIIGIMTGVKRKIFSRKLFKKFSIPLARKFLLSLLLFVLDNMGKFQTD